MKAYCIEIYVPVITWVQVFAPDEEAALKVAARALDEQDPSIMQLVHDNVEESTQDRSTCDTVVEVDKDQLNAYVPTYEVSGDGYQEVDDERYNELCGITVLDTARY